MPAIRNHLDIPYGLKLGDRMDPACLHLIRHLREMIDNYETGLQSPFAAFREIDNLTALMLQAEPLLPNRRMEWEGADCDQWIPKQ